MKVLENVTQGSSYELAALLPSTLEGLFPLRMLIGLVWLVGLAVPGEFTGDWRGWFRAPGRQLACAGIVDVSGVCCWRRVSQRPVSR